METSVRTCPKTVPGLCAATRPREIRGIEIGELAVAGRLLAVRGGLLWRLEPHTPKPALRPLGVLCPDEPAAPVFEPLRELLLRAGPLAAVACPVPPAVVERVDLLPVPRRAVAAILQPLA